MSIAEMIPEIRALSRDEKMRLAQILLEDLSREDPSLQFQAGQVFPIHTPAYAPNAAVQLAQVLRERGIGS